MDEYHEPKEENMTDAAQQPEHDHDEGHGNVVPITGGVERATGHMAVGGINVDRDLLARTIGNDLDDNELDLFVAVCNRTGLDPFAKQIYAIKRNDRNAPGGKKMGIQTSIDGFRLIAERSGRYAGQVPIQWCGPDKVWTDVWLDSDPPVAARAGVYKAGFAEVLYRVATWDQYVQTDSHGNPTRMWKQMGPLMLGKCLPGSARLRTDRGPLTIRQIVAGRLPVRVRSIDLDTGLEVWQPVVNWWTNAPTDRWVRLWAPNGERGGTASRFTHDHPVWTPTGWVKAGELVAGDPVAVVSPTISAQQDQVIRGGLLGDGHLYGRPGPRSMPGYDEGHAVGQEDYLRWKATALANLGTTVTHSDQDDGTGKRHAVVKMRTRQTAALLPYRSLTPMDLLDGLDDLGLAVWVMDDGSMKGTGGRSGSVALNLHCCGFGAEFADHAVAWFADRYGVTAKVHRRDRNPYLSLGVEDTRIIAARIAPYLVADGTTKVWVAGPIEQGAEHGMAFVPLAKVEHIVRAKKETRYDIEVEGTHTFVANGIVVSNCAEALALRAAFPAELSGLYTDDEMQQAEYVGARGGAGAIAAAARDLDEAADPDVILDAYLRIAALPDELRAELRTTWSNVDKLKGVKLVELPRRSVAIMQSILRGVETKAEKVDGWVAQEQYDRQREILGRGIVAALAGGFGLATSDAQEPPGGRDGAETTDGPPASPSRTSGDQGGVSGDETVEERAERAKRVAADAGMVSASTLLDGDVVQVDESHLYPLAAPPSIDPDDGSVADRVSAAQRQAVIEFVKGLDSATLNKALRAHEQKPGGVAENVRRMRLTLAVLREIERQSADA